MTKIQIVHFLVFASFFLNFVNSEIQSGTCNQNLKPDRYLSKNNANSSCDCDELRRPSRIITWSNRNKKCSLMNIDTDGTFPYFILGLKFKILTVT